MSVCVYDECEYNIWFWLHMLLHLSAASETLSLLFFLGGVPGCWCLVLHLARWSSRLWSLSPPWLTGSSLSKDSQLRENYVPGEAAV